MRELDTLRNYTRQGTKRGGFLPDTEAEPARRCTLGEIVPYTDELRGLAHWGEIFNGDSPCGDDLSLDPEFELLTAEIAKDKSIHAGQKTDWVVVYGLSDFLLARSKDLWAFSCGIISVYNTKSVRECVTCVNALAEILFAQWQFLHPSLKRPKRRIAPLKWMCDKFHSIADNTAFLNHNPNDLKDLNAAFSNLQEILDGLLPDNDLNFKSILRSQLANGQHSDQPESPAADVKPSKKGQTGNQTPQPMRVTLDEIEKSSIIPTAALPQVIRTINENARQLGDHLLAINKEDERAYHLHRIAIWTTLLQLPASEQNGLTGLSCPIPPDLIDMYTSGVNEKRFAEMLPQIERSASKAPFWLDGHYLIVKCLEGLSANLTAFSIKHALAQLVNRFPDLLTMKFKDGRPFASPKTVTWIDSFLPTITGNAPFGFGGQHNSSGEARPDEAKLLQDAIGLFQEKDFKAGLDHLGNIPPGKNRAFLRHSILKAHYCSAAGHQQAASQILRSVVGKLKNWDLMEWEPEMTAEAVSLLMSLSPKPKKEEQEELQLLLHTFSLETAIAAKKVNQN